MFTISVRDYTNGHHYYRATVSQAYAVRHDNGCLVSIGLIVGEDGFTPRMFKAMQKRFNVVEITHEAWNHSGCQSYCILRGAKECRW